ncbi:MAG: Nif3-like dinuclear metal center hexameric protein [Egibacteraceae bacterium]
MPADRVRDWVGLVDECYPEADAAGWDAVGLHVGGPDDAVTAVLVCLDVTASTLEEAANARAELLLAHHPLLFRPLERLTPATAPGRLALEAARRGIAVLAAHTNFDAALPGTTEPVVALLDLVGVRPLERLAGDETKGLGQKGLGQKGLGRIGRLREPQPLGAIARRLADGLPAPFLRCAGDLDAPVATVAACGGAGDGLIGAALQAGADVYVTGDLRHHVALDALTMGLAVVDAGHYATEVAALPALHATLAEAATRRGLRARLLLSKVSTEPWSDWSRWER